MKKESEKKMIMKTKVEDAIDEVVFEFAKTTFQLIKKYSRLKRLNKVSNSENKKNLKEIANRLNILFRFVILLKHLLAYTESTPISCVWLKCLLTK